MPPKKGVTVIKTGATHRQMDTYDKTIKDVEYTLFVPQRDCHNEMGKPYSSTINDIARRENYAQNGDEHDKWIAAIQTVFDNHYDEIKDVYGYKEFHLKKVYFLNSKADERGLCTYIAVQRKPYKDQTGDAKKQPKRNKTRKKVPVKREKGNVSEDGSGFIPASSTSAKKQKIMTKKAKAVKEVMGELYESDSSDDDAGFDTIMENIYDMKWNPKSEKYEKIPEQTLEVSDLKMAKSSSSESGSDSQGYSSSDRSSVLDYGSDASTDDGGLFDAFGNPTAYSIARIKPGTRAYRERMDKHDRRRGKEADWKKEKEMKKDLDDDLLEKVKRGMDIYDAYDEQNKRWQQQQDEKDEQAYIDQMTSEDESSESEDDRKRRMMILEQEYATANGWSQVMSKSQNQLCWYNKYTKVSFFPKTPNGEWTQKEADDAAERAKKKGGKKSRKKKKKTRRKKGGKRKKTKKRKLRKKRNTRR